MSIILAMLAIALPGLVAGFLNCRCNGKNSRKQMLARWPFYMIMINLLIYGGLYVIGKRNFNFLEMGAKFQVKWLLLGLGIAFFCSRMGVPRLKAGECLDRVKQIFPSALVLTVTYVIFSPSALFLNNINEFHFSYFKIAPIVFVAGFLFLAVLCLLSLCVVEKTQVRYYTALLFGLALGVYLQTNFLNPSLPTLDGTWIDWTAYAAESRVNVLCWALCLLLPLVLAFFQGRVTEKGISLLSWFFSAVQLVTLVVLIFINPVDNPGNFELSKADEFTLGAKDNIVIFVVDSLQASVMEEYLESGAYPGGGLDDFTFFRNAVSGGTPTYLGMTTLMTGVECEPLMQSFQTEAWDDMPLYDYLHDNGYDVRFFTTRDALPGVSDREADNYSILAEGVRIEKPAALGVQLYKLTNFYAMPLCLKRHFILTTETMTDLLKWSLEAYRYDDAAFYQELQEAGDIEISYDKTFRLYHLRGVHAPYILDENLERVEDGCGTEQQALQGNMKEIFLYLDEMKQAGVYDSSMIIIAGDHGRHQDGNLGANPAVLIKRPHESHPIAYSESPVHFRNIPATMAMAVMEDYTEYGPSVYDITEQSDVERLHTITEDVRERNTVDDAWDESAFFCRFIVPQNPMETEKFQIWNPYEINRVSYQMGKKIIFSENEGYARQINYRLYKEGNAAVASNELSICFALTNHPSADLTFHFTYDKIYGEKQDIRIYANGSRIGTVTCTQDMAGSDCMLVIPQDKVSDDLLVLRMVFPNAVTPNQLDRENPDTRVLSVVFDSMWLAE